MFTWPHSGSHLHTAVWVPEEDRAFATRLARYCARNPVALERLTYDRTAKAVTYRSDKSEGPTAGTEATRRWAALLQQIFEVDPLACPTCRGPKRLVAFITQTSVIDQILTHLRIRAVCSATSRRWMRGTARWSGWSATGDEREPSHGRLLRPRRLGRRRRLLHRPRPNGPRGTPERRRARRRPRPGAREAGDRGRHSAHPD